ncbi:SMI1/KNR4 family protein [Stenotrophomonas maltophilia]|uniref:SMI1/KNR4 family protein n=3 Tax=Stenotrophomonas TaxID=40323 RepID=A0ABT2XBI8_9GAMM|nr:SMI1/KNR4 family protein [Stenotrophomonas maltophilia]MCV0323016.1 SMI1/KNR4 family protein [Stenotrophomonas sp. CFS3442]HEL4245159.1 SMI1/KNR4 family protein [Stenotrophomonas maltophilia]
MRMNDLIQRVVRAYPDRRNPDCASAAEVMRRLGVAPHCDMWMFYMAINGALPAVSGRLELLRIVGPGIPKIPDQAEYVWDRYELPVNFLPLSSDQGEGMYLYDMSTEEVHDYRLARHDQFVTGQEQPRWESFHGFMMWYLGDASGT